MKKILFLTIIAFLSQGYLLAQTNEQKEEIASYEGFYKVEGDEVVFSTIIENIKGTKDEIYSRSLAFFANAYKSANDVIQMKDKDAGTVIGKGIFTVYSKGGLAPIKYTCNHTLRIDAKEGRARVILSTSIYDFTISNERHTLPIIATYPIAEKPKGTKKMYADVFIGLCQRAKETLSSVEKSLKAEGAATNAGDDW